MGRAKKNQLFIIKLFVIIIGLVFSASPMLAASDINRSSSTSQDNFTPHQKFGDGFTSTDFNLQEEHVENEVLVKFADWTPQELIDDTLEELGAGIIKTKSGKFARLTIDLEKFRQIREMRHPREPRDLGELNNRIGSQTNEMSQVLNLLNSLPHVDWVEPNYIAQALGVPNDPYYKYQWNFPLIGLESAWDQAQGDGVTVAIIDTGIAYEDWSKYRKASDLSQTQFVPGYNFINNRSHANDDNGHGTHIAGTIAGSTNNNEGVAGIAYKAKIMPIKALDRSGAGTYADISEAIRYAADHGADIINLSLGGPIGSNALKEAVKYANDKAVLVIAASGNNSSNNIVYPAAYDDYVLAVGAVRADKTKANYSNYGSSLDLVAPGGDISIDQTGDGQVDGILQQTLKQGRRRADTRRFNYYFYQGTSMAAPHVAGIAALVKSLGINDLESLKQILFNSAEDLGPIGRDNKTGYGLVMADKAVQLALQQETGNKEQGTGGSAQSEPENNSPNSQPPSQPSNPADPDQPVEEPPAEEPEPDLAKMILEIATYNLWGRRDSSFAFWERAVLGIKVKDKDNQKLQNVNLDIKIYNQQNKLVAKGSGVSNSSGELWMQLGNFSRGTYNVVVEAVKSGFKSMIEKVSFRFR